jgi:hypothetical protein
MQRSCIEFASMATTSLRSALDSLANSFANGVLEAIRSASIEDLLAESGGGSRRGARSAAPRGSSLPVTRATKSGRLARRSEADIAKAVEQVVATVRKSKGGMRAEEIRKTLNLDVREVPRILKTAVGTKKLKSAGQKRATTYTAR